MIDEIAELKLALRRSISEIVMFDGRDGRIDDVADAIDGLINAKLRDALVSASVIQPESLSGKAETALSSSDR